MSVLYFMRDYSENFHIKKPFNLTSWDILIFKDTVGSRQMCSGPYYIVDSRQNSAEPFGSSMTYKSFCLFQCIWRPSRVTYNYVLSIWATEIIEYVHRTPENTIEYQTFFKRQKFVFSWLLWPHTLISVAPIGNTLWVCDPKWVHMHWNKQKDF